MKLVTNIFGLGHRLAADERGGEVLEYALILGLVSVVTIVMIGQVGTRVIARWSSVNSSM